MHSTTLVDHQPTHQGLWYSGQVAEERKKRQRAVVLVVVLSVMSFVKRICVMVLGLLRHSYRKVGGSGVEGGRGTGTRCITGVESLFTGSC